MDMDMGMSVFKDGNMKIARDFWYIIASFLGMGVVFRAINYYDAQSRLRRCSPDSSPPTASRPVGVFLSYWATMTAIVREVHHPMLHFSSRFVSWLSPPPLGRCVVLAVYWLVVFLMATANAVDHDAYYWERIAFRNAWVTTTQLPLVFFLANKTNIMGILLGVGHERINWFHRWVARTMLLTATLHGWFFFAEWAKADFVKLEMQIMPMVKYGFGAWAVMLWNVLSTAAPLRSLAYEVFVAQHVLSSVALLWCIYKHVPTYARYNLWWAVALWAFDRLARSLLYAVRNTRLTTVKPTGCNGKRRFGHEATAVAVGDSTTIVTLKSLHFSWLPGQYVYLWIPSLGPLEAHPYTLAAAHRVPGVCTCNSVQLVIRKHSGFSKRLHAAAAKAQTESSSPARFVAFIAGPYGAPPRCDIYETLVLVAASTGASFVLPILEAVVDAKKHKEPTCTRRVDLILSTRSGEEVEWYVHRLRQTLSQSREIADLTVNVHVAKTQGAGNGAPSSSFCMAADMTDEKWADAMGFASESSSERSSPAKQPPSLSSPTAIQRRRSPAPDLIADDIEAGANCCQATEPISLAHEGDVVKSYSSRLDIASLIREPVEAASGETSVVVCGGPGLTARVRNAVASLSDERAVHKGTGAQGIHLYVEEYSF
ncbi:hypothetical protein TD95_001890 [Thielaviopsis punctulata]|uniref:ferric-chelate reductase (NADPH) n=1 Tax=Thielaviopsis punctulata TaxID=72032 RepID=A0A0F4ZEW4_9PEZI|nr:hypothetical protein TD95_001890 [Thielaviopsis punctulata]